MAIDPSGVPTAFSWNFGGWFGSQLGSTLWLLLLGVVLLSQDSLVAWLCIVGFVFLNVWGLYLWRSRAHLTTYAGLQRFFSAASLTTALVVVMVNSRGLSTPPPPGTVISTHLPYWVIAVFPGVMMFFFLLERQGRRSKEGRRSSGDRQA
jgi:hypothetical protein